MSKKEDFAESNVASTGDLPAKYAMLRADWEKLQRALEDAVNEELSEGDGYILFAIRHPKLTKAVEELLQYRKNKNELES